MIAWFEFWNYMFWFFFFCFVVFQFSFIFLMLIAELVWVVLYTITLLYGVLSDNLLLVTLSFFLLALGGVEFSLGFLLAILLYMLPQNEKRFV